MATYKERVAALELELEEAVAYGETTRACVSEACGNMPAKFINVAGMAQRDETNRDDKSSLQVGVHHNSNRQ